MEIQPSRRRRTAIGFVLTALGALGAVSALLLSGGGGRAAAQVPGPVEVDGNKTCADLAPPGSTWIELKVEPVVSGPYTDGTLSVTVTVVDTPSGPTVNWTSNIGVDAVFVKGGPGGTQYVYVGESMSGTGLHAPVNPQNGKYYGLSHLSFCYDVDVVTTTVVPPTTTTTYATTTTMATTTSKPHKTTTTMATTTTSEGSTTTTSVTTPPTTPPTTAPPPPSTAAPKPAAPPELPATGRNMTPLLLASLAMLGAGLGLTAASRRVSRS